MVADRRRIVPSFRRRAQIIWAAAAFLTVVGAAVAVAQPSTPTPTPTLTASPRPGGTSPALTPPVTPTATTDASLTPTGAAPSTPSESSTPRASRTSVPAQPESPLPQRPATPPASSTGAVPLSSVLIAIAVLVLMSLVLLRLARKGQAQVAEAEAALPGTGTEPATDVLVLLASAGEALIDSGFDVDDVDANLEDIARAYGMADTEIIALPTALLVSSGTGGRLRTRAVTSGRQRLRLHIVSFTPAFWLLVPGALGLVGVAALLNGDSTGTTTLITTVETMVAIALGVLVGRAISIIVSAREGRSSPPLATAR
jgi:Putative threonine/serine exporter